MLRFAPPRCAVGVPLPIRLLLAAALLATFLLAPPVAALELHLLATYDAGLGFGAAEVAAFDPSRQRVFLVNAAAQSVDIVDLTRADCPRLLRRVDLSAHGGAVNGVAADRGMVAAAVAARDPQAAGRVVFFDAEGAELAVATVGALPDMVVFTADGERLLVANEGEPAADSRRDPPGSVAVVRAPRGGRDPEVRFIGFEDFDHGGPRHHELPTGVRIFGPEASASQDLEPEYIALLPGTELAFVSLQENNAIARLDLAAGRVEAIFALGLKDHSADGAGLDPSDRDGGVAIRSWPVAGLFQPDGIAAFVAHGRPWVVSANEGDARAGDGFSEVVRVAELELDPAAFPAADALRDEAALGRLQVSTGGSDLDGDGDHDRLLAFGGRSFSVWDGASGELVFDSGAAFELITAAAVPEIFNANDESPAQRDRRSSAKGPEPEAVAVGEVDGRRYAFVTLERTGGVMIYLLDDPWAPAFVSYEPAPPGHISPEGVVFVAAAESPSGEPLLLVSHEVSGTLVVYRIGDRGGVQHPPPCPPAELLQPASASATVER